MKLAQSFPLFLHSLKFIVIFLSLQAVVDMRCDFRQLRREEVGGKGKRVGEELLELFGT